MSDFCVFVNVIEGVETHDYDEQDDDFFGECIVRIEDHKIREYCLDLIEILGLELSFAKTSVLSPSNAMNAE